MAQPPQPILPIIEFKKPSYHRVGTGLSRLAILKPSANFEVNRTDALKRLYATTLFNVQ